MHLQLGNNRSALDDSHAAVRRDSTATKVPVKSSYSTITVLHVGSLSRPQLRTFCPQAYYRGARAALRLKHWDTAQQLCTAALRATPDAQELAALLKVKRAGCSGLTHVPVAKLFCTGQIKPNRHCLPGSGGGCSSGCRAASAGARGSHRRAGAGSPARGVADRPWLAHRPASSHHRCGTKLCPCRATSARSSDMRGQLCTSIPI